MRRFAMLYVNIVLDNGRRIINAYLLEHKMHIFGTLSVQLLMRKLCCNFRET